MVRFVTALCLALALAGCASAPDYPARDSFDPRLLVRNPLAQIPMTNAGNRLWQVRAIVNDQPGIFAVDTGANETIITPQFAEKLGLLKTSIKGRFGGPNPLHQQVRYVRLIYLQLGEINYLDFYATVLNLDHLANGLHTHLDGILGNNVLGKTACTLDWSKKLLTLNADDIAPPSGAIPMIVRGYRAWVTAHVNQQPVEFILDTGAYSSTIAEKDLAQLHLPASKLSQIKMPRVDISEVNPLDRTQATFDTFQFGNINKTNFSMLTWDNTVLGMDVLEPRVLNYDMRGHWILLTDPPTAQAH